MHDLPSSAGRPSRTYMLPEASYFDEPLADAVRKVARRPYMHYNSLKVDAFRRQKLRSDGALPRPKGSNLALRHNV